MADKPDLRSKILESISPAKERIVSGASRVDKFVEANEKVMMYFLLAVISLFAAASRLLPFRDNISLSPEDPMFSQLGGYESYRSVMYAAKNFPDVLFADTLPNYPVDGSVMTGSLFDMVLGGVALLLSQFQPLSQSVTLVLYLVGPVFAVFMVLLVYKIGQEVFDRNIGIIAAVVLALIPGHLLQTTIAGAGSRLPVFAVLFATLSLSLIYYTRSARDNVFVFEFIREDLSSWNTFTKSLLSVTVLSIFFVLSQPVYALIYSAFIGFIAIQYSLLNSYKDDSPESVTSALFLPLSITALVVTATAVMIPAYTTIHVAVIGLVTALVGIMSLMDSISEVLEQPSPRLVWVTVLLGLIGVGAAAFRYGDIEAVKSIFQPSRDTIYYENVNSILTYDVSTLLIRNFGLFGFVSILGYLVFHPNALYNSLVDRMNLGSLVLTSFAIMTAVMGFVSVSWFTFTAMAVAIFGSYFVFFVAEKTQLFHLGSINIRAYHVLAVIAVVAIFIPVLIAPVSSTVVSQAQSQDMSEPAWVSASQQLKSFDDQPVDPYGNPMKEPESGVVTWANYGSDTIQGIAGYPSTGLKRPSPKFSSEYLLAQSERAAFNAEDKYNANAQYIVLDWRTTTMRSDMSYMVDKHPEFTVDQFYTPVYDAQNRRLAFGINKEPYYNALATRLYYYHGSRAQPQPVTVTYTTNQIGGQTVATTFLPVQMDRSQHIRKFRNMRQAQQYVQGTLQQSQEQQQSGDTQQQQADYDGIRQIGGIGIHPPSAVPALEHHRYVASSSQSILEDDSFIRYAQITSQYTKQLRYSDLLREDGQVKVFQQVEGVKIEGSGGPSNNTVQIVIALQNEQTGTPVRYVQTVQTDKDGNFEATLPYASEGVPEEYTVQPTQNYQMLSQVNSISQTEDGQLKINTTYWYSDEVVVTNEQVIEGATIQVQLEEMNSEEINKAIEGDGIVQPRQLPTTSDDSSGDGSTDNSSSSDGN